MRSVPDFLLRQSPCPNPQPTTSAAWLKTGVSVVDSALGGGLMLGRVHEFYAAQSDDSAAVAGFVAALAILGGQKTQSIIWIRPKQAVRTGGTIQGAGWAALGGKPENILFVRADDNAAMLRATHDALRCVGAGVVVAEIWGRASEIDLTVNRRLSLAAEQSGLALLMIRIDATPAPSAAETRWSVASAPSRALAAKAPGNPAFDIELLRQRGGVAGLNWRLEWDRDRHLFGDTATSGALLPLPVRRPIADAGRGTLRRVA
jgi:protein ImuA